MKAITKLSELFEAIESGERVEFSFDTDCWEDFVPNQWTVENLFEAKPGTFRIAPKLVTITGPGGTYEYPEPVRKMPANMTDYFYPAIPNGVPEVGGSCTHHSQHWHRRRLESGMIHLTEENAKAHAEALILAQGGAL